MERRTVLKLVALTALSPKLDRLHAAVACQEEVVAKTSHAADYSLQFFSEHESRILDELMEMIIPADEHSPGAHAAQTNLFADVMVDASDDAVKKRWRDGIRLMQDAAAHSSLRDALGTASANESNSTTDLERFFKLLKEMTIDGYYTSVIGIHQDLQYVGNTYLVAFPECPHPEHQS